MGLFVFLLLSYILDTGPLSDMFCKYFLRVDFYRNLGYWICYQVGLMWVQGWKLCGPLTLELHAACPSRAWCEAQMR